MYSLRLCKLLLGDSEVDIDTSVSNRAILLGLVFVSNLGDDVSILNRLVLKPIGSNDGLRALSLDLLVVGVEFILVGEDISTGPLEICGVTLPSSGTSITFLLTTNKKQIKILFSI